MKNIQSVTCFIPITNLEAKWGGEFLLPPNSVYTLIIDYPFDIPGKFPIKTGKNGMNFIQLMPKIFKAYQQQYRNADNDNRNGYWHGIDDLSLGGVRVNHNKKEITLGVDS